MAVSVVGGLALERGLKSSVPWCAEKSFWRYGTIPMVDRRSVNLVIYFMN